MAPESNNASGPEPKGNTMKRILVLALGAALAAPSGALAAGPTAHGPVFTRVAEVLGNGALRTTLTDGTVTIRVVGDVGATVKVSRPTNGVSIQHTSTRPKTEQDAQRYAASGRSAQGDLRALGAPESVVRQFADMQVAKPPKDARAAAAAVDPNEPYAGMCVEVTGGPEVKGYGCSTLFRVAAKRNGDWWLNAEYRVVAYGTASMNLQCNLFGFAGASYCPARLTSLGWGIGWGKGNQVTDWDPYATTEVGKCSKVTMGGNYHGAGVSVSNDVCPDRLRDWRVGQLFSGAEWQGIERGTQTQAAIGTQGVHSPPGAPASWHSVVSMQWLRFPS
jgi:hypothetical protein